MPGRIIDISQPLSPEIAVWPGDTSFDSRWVMRISAGDSVNVGTVTMSLHTGTHADAPLHVAEGSASIDECPLEVYVGEALVIDASDSRMIQERHVTSADRGGVERLLFKTLSATSVSFVDDFSYFTAEAARALVGLGATLVGIDTPSVDRFDSKLLDTHHIFRAGGVAILENLLLDEVAPGRYELIAAPLKVTGMDASPVRALLREL
jgi:arylformamidase